MTKKQARLFAIVSTALAAAAFIGMTIHSHTRFGELTNAQNITPAVTHGKDVWHKYNCINCHTLFGEGAYYAPDLTKITQHRGAAYLQAYMRDPAKFYDETRHRRLMPKQDLSEQEITDLIAFLDWVSKVDNQNWPPRPILVVGASIPGTDFSTAQQASGALQRGELPPGARPVTPDLNPIALGQALFSTVAPACVACHSVAEGVNMAGPSLAGIGTRAKRRIESAEYTGQAKDADAYIREAIVDPSAHVVPGEMYSADGQSFMPATYGKDLTPEQIDQLVAYLASLQ